MNSLTEVIRSITTYAGQLHFPVRKPYRVLVVDDDLSLVQLVALVLEDAGYVISRASDPQQALIQFENSAPFDLLLTDFNMPQMDGTELVRRIRNIDPSVKVLYVTGYSDALFRRKTRLWDDEAFLEKPCTPDGLVEAATLLLNGHVSSQKTVWG